MLQTLGRGISGAYFGGAGGDSVFDPSLKRVVASTVLDLDATMVESYAGVGGVWANLVAEPADGVAQTEYDFSRGNGSTAATYPTFVGTPGDADAYWQFDGGDYFQLHGTQTAFLKNIHKRAEDGQDFWLAIAWRTPPGFAEYDGLFSTQSSGSAPGVILYRDYTGFMVSGQRGDSTISTTMNTAQELLGSTDYVVIISHSHSMNQTRMWVNSPTASVRVQTYAAGSSDSNGPAQIGARGGEGRLVNQTRIYGVYLGNAYLDDAGAGAILTALRTRHGRAYGL